MNKICGYSCEHNKGGVCQITVCDKKLIMSDKTKFKIPYQDLTDININNLIVERNTLIQEYQKALDETMSEKIDIENNWNKLKQKIIDSFNKTQDVWFIDILQEIEKIEQGSDE